MKIISKLTTFYSDAQAMQVCMHVVLLRFSVKMTPSLMSLRIISSIALLDGVQIRIRGFVGFKAAL